MKNLMWGFYWIFTSSFLMWQIETKGIFAQFLKCVFEILLRKELTWK